MRPVGSLPVTPSRRPNAGLEQDIKDKLSRSLPSYFFRKRGPDPSFVKFACREIFPERENFDTGSGYSIYYSALRSFDNQRATWRKMVVNLSDSWLSKNAGFVFLSVL